MSTEASADFFGNIAYSQDEEYPGEEGISRDQWGRPLILDPTTGELTAYTRASAMANHIESTFGLTVWQKRLIAQGMGHRPDLAAMAAALPPYDSCTAEDKKSLQEIVDAALEVAKAYEKANWGTAVHAFTDPTKPSGPVPERMQADVRSHTEALEMTGVVVFATEIFVVNDRLKVAGTLDQVVGVPALNCAMVADTKTGKADLHKTAIQVGNYAESMVYDAGTGERTPIMEYVGKNVTGFPVPALNPDVGLYTHIPREQGKTSLHPLNLVEGREMLDVCAVVRDWKKSKSFVSDDATEWLTRNRRKPAMDAILAANDLPSLQAAGLSYKWCWDERLEKTLRARWDELGRPTQ